MTVPIYFGRPHISSSNDKLSYMILRSTFLSVRTMKKGTMLEEGAS